MYTHNLHEVQSFSIEDRYKIAASNIKLYELYLKEADRRIADLELLVKEANSKIDNAFDLNVGWAIRPESYTILMQKYLFLCQELHKSRN